MLPLSDGLEFSTLDPGEDAGAMEEVARLLGEAGLELEPGLEAVVAGRMGRRLVACAGMAGGTVKCVAIDPALRGQNIALQLMDEVGNLAMERGRSHLFLYTKPSNLALFQGCGFHLLMEVPGHACLLENTPVGLRDTLRSLAAHRQPGARIGGIVLNANPFTLGHAYLVRRALEDCDWLHVLVVAEDASAIPFADRLALVRSALSGLERVTVHAGSRYLVSKATFPRYFIKDTTLADACGAAMDLLMFRGHIAPALGITHRYVGTEPYCLITQSYNEDMHRWLEDERGPGPAVEVVEVRRLDSGGRAISASEVRHRAERGDFQTISRMVPQATLDYLRGSAAPRAADVRRAPQGA
jgi:[citrate (pro-3S)-lyase] ligase